MAYCDYEMMHERIIAGRYNAAEVLKARIEELRLETKKYFPVNSAFEETSGNSCEAASSSSDYDADASVREGMARQDMYPANWSGTDGGGCGGGKPDYRARAWYEKSAWSRMSRTLKIATILGAAAGGGITYWNLPECSVYGEIIVPGLAALLSGGFVMGVGWNHSIPPDYDPEKECK